MFALGLLPLTIVADIAPALAAVAVHADPHAVEAERLMRKAGDDEHVKTILAHDGQLRDIRLAGTIEPPVKALEQEFGTSQPHIWHHQAQHQKMVSAIQPAGISSPSNEASVTGSRQAFSLERMLATFKSFMMLRSRGNSHDTPHRAGDEADDESEDESEDGNKSSTIYLFRDEDCTENTLDSNATLPRFILPKDSKLYDGSCVQVNQTNSIRSENLRITCTPDGAQMLVIYGEDCKGGIDDKFKISFDSQDAELLGRGECVRALNLDVYQLMYVRLTIQDGDDIGLPYCVNTWRNYCMKHMFKLLVMLNVLVVIAFIGAVVVWRHKKQQKKLAKKLKKSSKQSAKKEDVDKPNEDKTNKDDKAAEDGVFEQVRDAANNIIADLDGQVRSSPTEQKREHKDF